MGRAALPARLASALLLGLVGLPAAPAPAQTPSPNQGLVVRDGSLGSGDREVGPGTDPLGQPATYLITPEMGEQRGRNLFHSFLRFGVGREETATFTGPDPIEAPQSVSNVISRVTGGTRSEIDGTLPGGHVGLEAQGEIALSASLVDVGRAGDTPGTISIRGGQIVVKEDSQVLAENESPVPAGSNEPRPGSISVEGSDQGARRVVDPSLSC